MRISHGARLANFSTQNGYGYVTDRMIDSLRTLGYTVEANDTGAPVNLWYDQPHHIVWGDNQYRIAYHPWESTSMREDWLYKLNTADEVWTPSELVAGWYRDMGVRPPVYVYHHGVDPVWRPVERFVEDKIMFLHVGGEAVRKGGDLVLKAFRSAFGDRRDVGLTMKMMSKGVTIPSTRVTFIQEPLPLGDLVGLYHSHHALVYPSWGEGFGLNPLQAMASGMPAVFTGAWAPYSAYAPSSWLVSSELVDSPWPTVHPGRLFRPDLDDLVDRMRFIADNYESQASTAFQLAPRIHEDFDWIKLTRKTFKCLEKRL